MPASPEKRRANRVIARARVLHAASDFEVTEVCAPSQERPSVHLIRRQGPHQYRHLFLADLHVDHKSFQHELLAHDLTAALQANATISIHGDLFDVMQSKDDPRGSLNGLVDAVNGVDYLDRCVNYAVELLRPYATNIVLITDGNHETNVLKRKHTDLNARVCERLKEYGYRGGHGWYQGWMVFQQVVGAEYNGEIGGDIPRGSLKVYYHHGAGGSAKRSRGILGLMSLADKSEGADVIVAGHLHMGAMAPLHRYTLDHKFKPKTRTILMGRTGTYKDDSGAGGWGVEKDFGPPTLGGLWLDWAFGKSEGQDVRAMRAQLIPTEAALLR
jgi:hypothetical protein